MTNKPMLSVERQCKECGSKSLSWDTHSKTTSGVAEGRLRSNEVQCLFVLGCNECSETILVVGADKVAVELNKLRALLDKPVPFPGYPPVPDDRKLPAAQHQCEPVRWERMSKMMGGAWWPCANKAEADEAVTCGWTVRPLYAEQPAPVAVVMPERMKDTQQDYSYVRFKEGYNAALETVARLNGVNP